MKNVLFILMFLFATVANSQFSKLKTKHGKSLIHNSIAKSKTSSNFYVVASTIMDRNGFDINVAKIDNNGATLWERKIDLRDDDRVLDVVIDDKDDIYIAGYIGNSSIKQLYIAKFNSAGILLNDFILNTQINSVGTKIIISKKTRTLYIGGYTYTEEKPFDMESSALLISVTDNLKKLNWESEYSLSLVNNTITDIVELPNNNLFITGSLGKSETGQIVLSAIVDPESKGDIILNGNLSFGVSEDYSLGASAVYDKSLDYIWLLFNAGSDGKPYYIGISKASTSGPIMLGTGIVIDVNNTPIDKYAGFKIMLSPSNSNGITIFGYKDKSALYSSGFGVWAIDIDKHTGMINGGLKLWNASGPTVGLEFQGGEVLSLFSSHNGTGMPYFHTPDIAVESHDGRRFVALTMDDISGGTEVGILSFNNNLLYANSPCLKFLDPLRYSFTTNSKLIFKKDRNLSFSNNRSRTSSSPSIDQLYCSIYSITKQGGDESKTNSNTQNTLLGDVSDKLKFTAFPNPTNGLLSLSFENNIYVKEIKVFNNLGQVVYEKVISDYLWKTSISLDRFNNGIYSIMVIGEENEMITKRITKL